MNKKSQVKLGMLLLAFALILVVAISAISFSSNQFYTNQSSLTINLADYFSQSVTSYSLSIQGEANADVLDNKLEITNITSSSNITLVAFFEENITKEFYVYYEESLVASDDKTMPLIPQDDLAINNTLPEEIIINNPNTINNPDSNSTSLDETEIVEENQTDIVENITTPIDEIINNTIILIAERDIAERGISAFDYLDNSSLVQYVNDCGVLNTTDAVYTLTSNVTSNLTCFTIQANNITLDGAGYTINYSANGTVGYGVLSGYNFTTVKNVRIDEMRILNEI